MTPRAAISLTWRLAFVGAGLVILSGWLAFSQWPGSEVRTETDIITDETTSEVVDTGSEPAAMLGLAGVAAGQFLISVSAVSFGVRFGRQSSPTS